MNLESPILGQADPSFLKCTEQFTMADVQISAHPGDLHSMQEAPMELYQPDIAIDTGAEVEVSTGSRRGRGRPKKGFLKKETVAAEGTTKPKRAYKKRAPKIITETDAVPKAKRKYTPRRPKSTGVESTDKKELKEPKDKKGKDKRKEGGRRKKEPAEKKPRERKPREKKPPREKKQKKKDLQIALPVNPIQIAHHSDSSNDSVVFCSEQAPSPPLPPAPPGPLSPHGAGGARRHAAAPRGHGRLSPASSNSGGKGSSQVISRLEDSSSSGGSDSGSSSSDDEDGSSSSDDSSQSDKERQRYTPSPPPPPVIRSNGVSNHLSVSEDWSDRSSASEGEGQGRGGERDDAARLDSPPRSPSSASSECPDKPFQCHTCKKWFSTTVTLRIHKRSHVAKPSGGSGSGGGRASRRYECDCCEATFTRRERLEQHRSERHRGTLTERCEVCGRGFEDEEQQKRHFATHTPDERAGRCTECGEIYSSWEQLRRHRAAHAPPAPHACPLCRKAFTYSHSLSRHLSNHSKAVYKCVVCKTSFNDANSLASHLNSHLDRYRQLKTS